VETNGAPRRIAFLLDNVEGGGVQRMTLVLAGEFARHGYPTDVLVCQNQGALAALVPERVRLLALGSGGALATCRLAASSGAYIAAAVTLDQILAHRWLRYARRLPALTEYLVTHRPACLISATPRINLLAVMAVSASGAETRSVVTERIAISPKLADEPELRLRQLIPLMKRSYRLASRVVAVSRDLADDVAEQLALPREHVETIYNPVIGPEFADAMGEPLDDPWFAPGALPVVLSAGRSSDQKDFDTLLRAFAEVRRQRPCRLVILGQEIGRSRKRRHEDLTALADELGDLIGRGGICTLVMRPSRLNAWRNAVTHFVESRDDAEWMRDDDRSSLPLVRSLLWPLGELCADAMRAALSPPAPHSC
jgi:glycosyltransferase involved in cell wall biosynthesis